MSRYYVPISEVSEYVTSRGYREYPKDKVDKLIGTFKVDVEVDEPSIPVEMLVYTTNKDETEILQIEGNRENILHNTRMNVLRNEGSIMTPTESIKEWVLLTYSKHFEKFPSKVSPYIDGVIINKDRSVILTIRNRVDDIRDFK